MNVPSLGDVTKDPRFGWLYSRELPLAVLGGRICRIVLAGYEEVARKQAFHEAIANFVGATESVLKAAAPYVLQYYQDINSPWGTDHPEYVTSETPEDLWNHVQLGHEPMISRRRYGDRGVYVSVECECDWEPEHGLQIVFKNGAVVKRVGPYDGNVTNSDAYADESLELAIYKQA